MYRISCLAQMNTIMTSVNTCHWFSVENLMTFYGYNSLTFLFLQFHHNNKFLKIFHCFLLLHICNRVKLVILIMGSSYK